MGTNFYLFTNKKEHKPFFGSKATLVDEPDFGYLLHIAKTSAGWKPCFEAHEHIRSVADLKALYDKGDIRILDEYDYEYNWVAFVERVINHGDEHNWRTFQHNDCPDMPGGFTRDFISVDGYWFTGDEFS